MAEEACFRIDASRWHFTETAGAAGADSSLAGESLLVVPKPSSASYGPTAHLENIKVWRISKSANFKFRSILFLAVPIQRVSAENGQDYVVNNRLPQIATGQPR